ncbi:MAG: hypothetical protein GY841_14770 [FCB group bacterium]|nr:hypothetical protein [FCB group bacterium]
MSENKYASAGWLAIICAALFPIGFVVGIVQSIIGARAFGYSGPVLGPSDLIFLAVTIIGIYVLVVFRRLLNERYEYDGINTLITLAIAWNIIFELGGLALKGFSMVIGTQNEMATIIITISFMAVAMISIGIIDIIIALRLMKIADSLSDLMKTFVYLSLIAGIIEVTVILTPLALLLVPVNFVVLGLIFLKEKKEVEFV